MESRLTRSSKISPWKIYGVAVATPLLALLVRIPLFPVLGHRNPFVFFFLSTAISATYGGFGPGLLATLLGGLLAQIYVMLPYSSLSPGIAGDYLGLGLYLSIGTFISFQAGRLINATRHENALRVLFQQTLRSIGDGVISTDDAKRVRLMNGVAEDLTGWKDAEARDKPIDEVFHIVREGSEDLAEIPMDRILKAGKVVGLANPIELISRDGRRIPIDDSGAPIRDEQGRTVGAVLVFRDIRERRQVEQALEEAERRATGILECIADGFLLLDAEWRILQINPAAERILGAHAASMAGRNLWEEFPLAVGTQFESNLRQAMAEKTAAHFENCYRPWDRWFDVSAYPLPEGLAIYFRDITERKRNETALIRLNEDLKQFTFAATHDLREPLRAISAYAQLLQQRVAPQLGDEGKLFVSHLYGGAQRVTRLIEGLLQFTRLGEPDESKPSRVDAGEAMRDAVNNLHLAIAEAGAKIESEPLPPVLGNFAHVCQLFQNLVANGIKYRKPGVVPQIRIRAERTGQLWVFAVEDNGIGISPEDGERIFVPFKRLHGAEIAGAGIGLATCKRIVTRYGGNIWVKSVPEQGSTFYFSLPSAD